MAYVHGNDNARRRAGAAIAVIVLEGVAIIALVRGLSIAWTPHEEPPPLASQQWKLDPPPPPPPPDPRPRTDPDRPVIQPRQARDPALVTDRTVADPPVPFVLPADPGPRADPLPREPEPLPTFVPRAARPIGSPASWVSANDYPARDLREGNEGLARFSLVIGADGRPQSCLVTQSSGHAGLDEATCKAVMRRARFTGATDENGARVAGSYAGSIRWQIPD